MTRDEKNQAQATPAGTVRKSTLWLAVAAALVIGVYAGAVGRDLVLKQKPKAQPREPVAEQAPVVDTGEFERRVLDNPADVKAWVELGNVYFDTHQAARSVAAYTKAMELDPGQPDVLTDMGVMLRELKKPAEALAAFDKAVALDPKHEIARFNKGIVLLHDKNDRPGAIRAWEELLAVNPAARTPNGQPLAELVAELRKAKAP